MRLVIISTLLLACQVSSLFGQCVISLTCRPTPPKVDCECEIEELNPFFIGTEATANEDVEAMEDLGFVINTSGNCGKIFVNANDTRHHPTDCQDSFYITRVYNVSSEFTGNVEVCIDTFYTEFIPANFLVDPQNIEISCEDNVDSLFQAFTDNFSYSDYLDCQGDVEFFYTPRNPILSVETDCSGNPSCGDNSFVRPQTTIFGPCHNRCLTIDKEDSDTWISRFCVVDTVPAVITCPIITNTLDLGDSRLEPKIDSILGLYNVTFGCTPPLITDNFHVDSIDLFSCMEQVLEITMNAEEACVMNSSSCTFDITITNEQEPIITFIPDTLFLSCGNPDNLNEVNNWRASLQASDFRNNSIRSTATDNFDNNNLNIPNCNNIYTVIFTVTDRCDRTASESTVIVINDEVPAEILQCPGNLSVNADDTDLVPVVDAWLAEFMATDVCDPNVTMTSTFDRNWLSFNCGTIDTTIIFSADDNCIMTDTTRCEARLVIQDNVTYEFSSFPNDTTIQCENPINVPVLTAWAATAVGSSSLGVTYTQVSVDLDYTDPRLLSCNDEIDVTFSFTNDCDVTTSRVAKLNIQDDIAPTISCPADATFSGNFDDILPDITNWIGTAVASDNCSARVLDFFDGFAFQDCDRDTVSADVSFQAQDACMNRSDFCSAELTLITDKNPLISCPDRLILECGSEAMLDSIISWSEKVISTNYVGVAIDPTSNINFNSISLVECQMETQVIFTVFDTECNRVESCMTSITVQDTQRPNITCPGALTINSNSTTIDQEIADWIALAEFDDNDCRIPTFFTEPSLDNIDFCTETGSFDMTFTVIDDCLLQSSCIAVINFNNRGPDITCPTNALTLECGDPNIEADILSWLTEATAEDNAAADLSSFITNDFDPTVIEDRCTLNIPISFEVTDDCMSTSNCVENIRIVDTTAPVVDCPTQPLNLLAGDTTKLPKYLTWLELIPVNDCNEHTITDNFDESVLIGFDCDEINYDLTITVTDNCGIATNCMATISIQNNITTTFINCDVSTNSLNVECSDTSMQDEILQWMAQVSAVDVFNNEFPTEPSLDATDPNLLQCGTVIPVTFELSDQCGVAQSCQLNLTINDTTRPDAICPQDTSFVLEDPNFNTDVQAWLAEISGIDACMTSLIYGDNYTMVTALPACSAAEDIPITFTVDDGCNNVATCISTLTVTTNQVPSISCPNDIVIECGDATIETTIAAWIAEVEGRDANSLPLIPEFNFSINEVFEIECDGSIPITFRIEDNCTNVDSCSSTIIIEDTTPPEATCPMALTINSTDPIGPQTMQDWIDSFSPTDNCSMSSASIQNGIITPSSFCVSPDEIPIAFYAEDVCGMRDTCVATITVNTAAPTINCQDNLTIECGDPSNMTTILDWIDTFSGEDNNGIAINIMTNFTSASLSMLCEVSEPITFTALDVCGQETTCVREIQQTDTAAPVITNCPSSIVIDIATPNVDGQITDWRNLFRAEDACNAAILSDDYALELEAFDCGSEQDVTFTAVDDCGNTNSDCISNISFENNLVVSIDCPESITVKCNDGQTLQTIINFLSEWTVISEDEFEVTNDLDLDNIDTNCSAPYSQDVMFTIEDLCGNTDQCQSSIEFIPSANIYIPTIFSPREGGDNARFAIRSNIAVTEITSLRVYSRWGDLMYENENFDPNLDQGWNGRTSNGNFVQGVYTYRLVYNDIFGNPFEQIGTITVL